MSARLCRCGHAQDEHTKIVGPNSIGQSFAGLCAHGCKVSGPYLVETRDRCRCDGFRKRPWWRWSA